MADWWKDFFDADYLKVYQDVDMQTAQKEADFVRKTLKLRRGQKVLDVCCGYGRHAVPLARAGLAVTGFDHSRFFLNKARREAKKARVNLTLVEGDVRAMSFDPVFDAAINMFTSIGFFESDEENYQLIERAAAALKPGGQFLLDTINRDMIVRHPQRRGWREIRGGVSLEAPSPDWCRSRLNVDRTLIFTNGRRRKRSFSLRIYTLAEVVGMFERAGLEITKTFGNFDGSKYTLDSPRIIVVGRKPGRVGSAHRWKRVGDKR
jgi:SAM-dependent methyltransferase